MKEVCKFIDEYGDERVIHRNRGSRLAVKRQGSTVCLQLNAVAGPMVGRLIRKERQKAELSMSQLCKRAGIVSSTPKQRMHEIEVGSRQEGLRFGTLYAIAKALDIPIHRLMPSVEDVFDESGVGFETIETLTA